mmetsp:Transcript_31650/g.94687  ORF Transcript_31650/g.94687 Transcript_31650/m.94687 type:complete len:504 (-) Transcript_31650:1073-2584(-)
MLGVVLIGQQSILVHELRFERGPGARRGGDGGGGQRDGEAGGLAPLSAGRRVEVLGALFVVGGGGTLLVTVVAVDAVGEVVLVIGRRQVVPQHQLLLPMHCLGDVIFAASPARASGGLNVVRAPALLPCRGVRRGRRRVRPEQRPSHGTKDVAHRLALRSVRPVPIGIVPRGVECLLDESHRPLPTGVGREEVGIGLGQQGPAPPPPSTPHAARTAAPLSAASSQQLQIPQLEDHPPHALPPFVPDRVSAVPGGVHRHDHSGLPLDRVDEIRRPFGRIGVVAPQQSRVCAHGREHVAEYVGPPQVPHPLEDLQRQIHPETRSLGAVHPRVGRAVEPSSREVKVGGPVSRGGDAPESADGGEDGHPHVLDHQFAHVVGIGGGAGCGRSRRADIAVPFALGGGGALRPQDVLPSIHRHDAVGPLPLGTDLIALDRNVDALEVFPRQLSPLVRDIPPVIGVVLDEIVHGHLPIGPNVLVVKVGVEHDDGEGEEVRPVGRLLVVLAK